MPPRIEARTRPRRQTLPRPFRLMRLALLLAVGAATFVVSSGVVRSGADSVQATAVPGVRVFSRVDALVFPGARAATRSGPAFDVLAPPPAPRAIEIDRAGSAIAAISFPSRALGWRDTYLVYLPPGYRAAVRRRYPVLYLLHGDNEPASSFLRLGLQSTLDRLIRTHAIAPMIAVMLQANGLPNNWRNTSGPQYNSYVGEVQRLTDRILRTIPARSSRGIAGYSMGGFGAMNVALAQLRSYSLVESWEGYFNNLAGELAADRPLLARLPLYAFVWGGRQDPIAESAEDGPWAAALRAAGAHADSAVFAGAHTFTALAAHLAQMLTFAGRQLRS
jgi:S-formylglutathione hydrolase FrmB